MYCATNQGGYLWLSMTSRLYKLTHPASTIYHMLTTLQFYKNRKRWRGLELSNSNQLSRQRQLCQSRKKVATFTLNLCGLLQAKQYFTCWHLPRVYNYREHIRRRKSQYSLGKCCWEVNMTLVWLNSSISKELYSTWWCISGIGSRVVHKVA